MIKLNLQFFGGNGSSTPDGGTPGGGGGDNNGNQAPFSNGLGTRVYSTAAEALGSKGRPMGTEQAALGANPNYSADYREYSENCQRCVVAYEARRRGYDVVAQPTYQGDTLGRNGAWEGCFDGAQRVRVGATTAAKAQKNVESVMAGYGEGSRAVVSVQWTGCSFGHVINVEQKGGKTIYRDAQTGVRYTGSNFFAKADPKSVSVIRTDNLNFTDMVGKAVTKDKY